MRIVRERMICVVSPHWPTEAVPDDVELGKLKDLCRAVGVIHFASIALLPPLSGQGGRSLLLELVVDEGLRPRDVLERLAFHPSGVLWSIYSGLWPDQAEAPLGTRNQMLLDHLIAHVSVADGAFVGPRDLPVSTIQAEFKLWSAVRAQASKASDEDRGDPQKLASFLSRWLLNEPAHAEMSTCSPRSYWRGAGATSGAKLRLLAMAVIGVTIALWLVGCAVAHRCSLDGVHQIAQRTLRIVVAALIAYAIVAVLPRLLFPWYAAWQGRLRRALDQPALTMAGRVAHVFGWATALLLVAGVGVAIAYFVAGAAALTVLARAVRGDVPHGLQTALAAFAALYALSFLLLLIGLRPAAASRPRLGDSPLLAALRRLQRWFHHPRDDNVVRAQQVHESIERCEAALVGGTAHMISLTDLRGPHAWSALWTCLVLRVVTFFGHVLFTEGRLGSIQGIQYAHWHILDGNRLLFCSNFDGTFGGYLDDFINGAGAGTTLFWRWTTLLPRDAAGPGQPKVAQPRAFPPTRVLAFRGVTCELLFKTYARESMVPHLVRFDAFNLSARQKIRSNQLRNALAGERNNCNDDIVMRMLES